MDEVSGFVMKSDQLVRRWDGRMVCRDWDEPRHPQEFLKTPPDTQAVPWNRPYNTNTEIPTAGVGVWSVGHTFVVAPGGLTQDQLNLWLANDWPRYIQ